ncbi:MAG: hypothetical protein ABUS47_08745 [Steroidobacter sp.]
MRNTIGALMVFVIANAVVSFAAWGQRSTAQVYNNSASMFAEAAPASSITTSSATKTIGVCSLIGNSEPPNSAANTIMPILAVNSYFASLENLDVGYDGKVALVRFPIHGTLVEVGDGTYSYRSTDGFVGYDNATFMVEIGGYKVTTIYTFDVMNGVPGGTDGYDPYDDPKYCPTGEMWKISLDEKNIDSNVFALISSAAWPGYQLKDVDLSLNITTLTDGKKVEM